MTKKRPRKGQQRHKADDAPRPTSAGEDGSSEVSDRTIARCQEVASYGDLIDDYFRMVEKSQETDDLIEVTTDDLLRYARARRRRERNDGQSGPS
jgi:hypothetical protein